MINKYFLIIVTSVLFGALIYVLILNSSTKSLTEPSNTTATTSTPTDDSLLEFCDEFGNRFATENEARAAGLSDAEFASTYCTENQTNPMFQENSADGEMLDQFVKPSNQTKHDEIIGMSIDQARTYANSNNVQLRIGMVDGEAMALTMDYRPGRITATITDEVITSYSIE